MHTYSLVSGAIRMHMYSFVSGTWKAHTTKSCSSLHTRHMPAHDGDGMHLGNVHGARTHGASITGRVAIAVPDHWRLGSSRCGWLRLVMLNYHEPLADRRDSLFFPQDPTE